MHLSFVVQFVGLPAQRQMPCGSIADRPFIRTITVASGKNFIDVTVAMFGGHGAAIVRPLTWCAKILTRNLSDY